MQIHRNAKTTPKSRLEIARRTLIEGQSVEEVARSFGVSAPTVRKWARRFDVEGESGLEDRSSAPHWSPRRTPAEVERRVERLRRKKWLAWQISEKLNLALSTVCAILRRLGLGRLSALEPQPAPPRRYERERPGELLHIDIKKLGRIQGIGHRITGNRRDTRRGVGWEYTHVCIDDHTRLAYSEVLENERKEACAAFLVRAVRWFREQGIESQSVMTDNGSGYRSKLWKQTCQQLGLRHLTTRPYTPRTNGKAERLIQTLLRCWAYAKPYASSRTRSRALSRWLTFYNDHRPHRALGGCPPRQRLLDTAKQRA